MVEGVVVESVGIMCNSFHADKKSFEKAIYSLLAFNFAEEELGKN